MCRLLRKGNRWRLLSKHLSCKHGWMSTGSALRGWFSSFQSDTLCSESTPDLAATNTVVLLVPCTQFNIRASQLWWGFPGFNWTTRRLLGAGSRPACVAQEVEQSFRQLQPALHTVVCMQERLQTLMALADPCVILLTQGNYSFVSWPKSVLDTDLLSLDCPSLSPFMSAQSALELEVTKAEQSQYIEIISYFSFQILGGTLVYKEN